MKRTVGRFGRRPNSCSSAYLSALLKNTSSTGIPKGWIFSFGTPQTTICAAIPSFETT